MTVGDRIRARRIELGLSQTQLALKIGVTSRSTVNKDEIKGKDITAEKLSRYAQALKCSEAYLLGKESVDGETDTSILAKIATDPALSSTIKKFILLNDDYQEIVASQIYSLYNKQKARQKRD